MDVSKQINHNDCGICVINSFFKHFYKRDIKEELLQEANITQKGLSIFDFENLCIKHGMHSEVYQVDNNELKNLNHNGYFIVLLNKMDGRHYVIIRKKNKHIECIDSIDGFKIIDIENLIKDFSGIIIFIKKACYDFKITNNKIKLFKNINFKYLLINILLQVTIITFSIVGSNYFSFFINNSLVNNTYVNGLIISFLFLLIFVINELSKFLCNLLSNKQMKQNFYKLSNDFVEKIKDKDESFFYKINQNYLYLIDVIIKSIAAYNTIEFCNFIASCISIVVLFCVISSIGNLYAIICLIIILILGIFGFLKYKFKNNIFGKIIRNGVANSSISNKLINYLKYQHNQLNFKSIIENIKSNYSDYLSIQNISSKFNGFTNMILNITEKFILIITLTLTSFFFSDEIIYTKLFLLIMLLGIFWGNINSVIIFSSTYIEYKKMMEIYMNIINIGNKKPGKRYLNKVTNISYNKQNNMMSIKNGQKIDIDNFDKLLSKYSQCDDMNITINKIDIKDISNEWINENILIFNYRTNIDKNLVFDNLYDNKLLIDFIKVNNFDLNKYINNDKIWVDQVFMLLACTNIKNKIIYFDCKFDFLPKEIKKYIFANIIPYVKANNFVIFTQ